MGNFESQFRQGDSRDSKARHAPMGRFIQSVFRRPPRQNDRRSGAHRRSTNTTEGMSKVSR
jgi:hypothetical protein